MCGQWVWQCHSGVRREGRGGAEVRERGKREREEERERRDGRKKKGRKDGRRGSEDNKHHYTSLVPGPIAGTRLSLYMHMFKEFLERN